MLPAKNKTAFVLSVVIVLLAATASAGGLFIKNLYRDNAFIKAAWQGNDLVTLVVVVPVLTAALGYARRGSPRAFLVWVGGLGYMLYNYIFYLYGAAFNYFFLLYAAIFSLSVYALLSVFMNTDVSETSRQFHPRTPVKWISGFMLFFSVPWSAMEISRAAGFIFTGQVPADIVMTGHPTGVVYATDLSLLMPAMILGAVLLWKRRPWGYLLGAVLMFKGCTYGLALLAMAAFAAKATGYRDPFTPVYVFLFAGSLLSFILLLVNMRPENRDPLPLPLPAHTV